MGYCRCHFPASTLSVSGAELHRWSLRFVDDGMEKGFLNSRTGNVVSGMFACSILMMTASVALSALLLIGGREEWRVDQLEAPQYGTYCALLSLFTVACLTATWSKVQWLTGCCGPVGREILGCVLATFCMVVGCFAEGYYMASFLGYNPWMVIQETPGCEHTIFSDSRVLLSITGIVAGSHFVVPIRWKIMTAVPVTGVLMYMVLLLTIGSVEAGLQPAINWIVLTFTTFAISLGKRRMEWHERFHFVTVIEEKKLRCQSEFQLACLSDSGPRIHKEEYNALESESGKTKPESVAESGKTASIFEGLEVEVPNAFEEIMRLGRKEHWLIKSDELKLLPESLLGSGGFGVVVAGVFEGVPVAVKVSRLTYGRQSLTRGTANELRVLRYIRHPNIVLFNGACIDSSDGSIALVLEYVEGTTLAQFIGLPRNTDEMHPLPQRYQLILGICCALRYLHSRTPIVVHGDLKSSNVMVEVGPRAKLLDFGLSRLITAHAKPLGRSSQWCAPEVLLKKSRAPSRAADVYSFGCLARFIAAGEKPFMNMREQLIQKLAAVGIGPFLPRSSPDRLATHSEPMMQLCLSADPRKRPSMRQIFEILVLWPEELHFEPVSKSLAKIAAADRVHSASQDFKTQVGNISRLVPSSHTQKLKQDRRPQQHEQTPSAADPITCDRFEMTPKQVQYFMIMEMLQRWSFPVDHLVCCKYHAALDLAHQLVSGLKACGCYPAFQDEGMVQCPSCLVLDDVQNEPGSFQCTVCGGDVPNHKHRNLFFDIHCNYPPSPPSLRTVFSIFVSNHFDTVLWGMSPADQLNSKNTADLNIEKRI